MEAPRLERKLVAILAADIEGYSRHMERDEAATLAPVRARRHPAEEHRSAPGRLRNTAGDGVLAEFASAAAALQCALDIQTRSHHARSRPRR